MTTRSQRVFSTLIVRVAIGGIMLGLAAMILAVAVLKGFKQEIIAKQRGFFGDLTFYHHYWHPTQENEPFVLDGQTEENLYRSFGAVRIQPFATKPAVMKANGE